MAGELEAVVRGMFDGLDRKDFEAITRDFETLEGQRQHISAPTTVVLRRAGDGWKMVLFHSIPLPESEAS